MTISKAANYIRSLSPDSGLSVTVQRTLSEEVKGQRYVISIWERTENMGDPVVRDGFADAVESYLTEGREYLDQLAAKYGFKRMELS